eukprot:Em0758g5a
MVYSYYQKLRILFFYSKGLNPPAILKRLQEEGMLATRQGIWKFIKKFNSDGKIGRRLGSGRKTNIISEIKAIVNEQMKKDDETTASQLHALLISRGYYLSYRAILRCRSALGWTFRGSAYCQMIGEQNKLKRLNWAIAHLHEAETGFKDVVWTDECTVQLESHRRICCLKGGEAPKNKQRATKVHVWAGISLEGATGICIFDGVMDGPLYIQILQQTLLPFLRDVLPHGHRFMADNDPKNASRLNQQSHTSFQNRRSRGTLTLKAPAGVVGGTAPKKSGGLFDDDEDDMFSSSTKVTTTETTSTSGAPKPSQKPTGLFDEDEGLFASSLLLPPQHQLLQYPTSNLDCTKIGNTCTLQASWLCIEKEVINRKCDANGPPLALNACLATGAQDGTISNRVVTMGSFNKDGFVFFTSAEGRKAKELESNPNCALTFYWPTLWRQVRIEGTANLLPDERSEEYFRKLPFENQIVLNNARQSEAKCRDEMERAMSADSAKPVPKPSFLKGYQITPTWIEFNQAQENFLSDRLVFTRPASAGDKWELQHLAAY